MAYELKDRLVVGLASSALFDLEESDAVFRRHGETAYRQYQRDKQHEPLRPGVAFPFIRRLLSLNALNPQDPPVEVVLLSRNDPDTGMRVMESIASHGLGITRAVFLQGKPPHAYIPALEISLFLSANETDVREAIAAGYPAGQVLESAFNDDDADHELRIAFDFDGVLADDESESVFKRDHDLEAFHAYETKLAAVPLKRGPLAGFLSKLSQVQQREREKQRSDPEYRPRLRIAIATARNAPAHERVINTMRSWGIVVNEAFFLGGIEKRRVLEVLRPHIFFDDQKSHLELASRVLPAVHIPFGVANSSDDVIPPAGDGGEGCPRTE
ncbi:5'-nucleotidase [Oleidesulfovibrio alaskensis G20]|jgi:5'-nucleotidase|uniref:5'-nucleotidase n=1 Tax=Oleidesulfovibrio alaskensis (strain ATCC BAA-1058 / DSM 17464 / G20) TaxID=207559 RepID=Q314Q6_OLEA2|nr:5'-nucleotidase [Oleidesulfovibrio alaskensis]ABB37590.1 5'-nucleotidase [Oleidesulfovibrio alaskensis G20]MBG0774758.1 5'-nucleotidase [Oleidesulfovibrio alaskensis]MBL3581343.1 5'-nucleotidase [Oleidesulfovibrio alaskensis]